MLLALPGILARYHDAKVYVAGNSLVNYKTLKEKLKISAYGKYLRRLLKEGGLEEKVVFLGKLSASQLLEQNEWAGSPAFLRRERTDCCMRDIFWRMKMQPGRKNPENKCRAAGWKKLRGISEMPCWKCGTTQRKGSSIAKMRESMQ